MPLTDDAIQEGQAPRESPQVLRQPGLYLQIAPRGTKAWRFKYRFAGKEKRISMGDLSRSLAEARPAAEGRGPQIVAPASRRCGARMRQLELSGGRAHTVSPCRATERGLAMWWGSTAAGTGGETCHGQPYGDAMFRPAGGCFQALALAPDTSWRSRNAPMSSISRNEIEACGCPWVWKTCLT